MKHHWEKHWGKILMCLLIITLLAWYGYLHRDDFSRDKIVAYGRGLSLGWFLAAFLVLPMVGFPISILLFLAGVRFGFGWGLAIAAAGIIAHNVAAYHMTHGWFREYLKKRLGKSDRGIPSIGRRNHIWYTMLFAAVHGPPYTAKIYLLALTDVSFRVYFWAGVPVYVFFGIIPIGAGSAAMTFDPKWIYILVTLLTLITLATHWLQTKSKFHSAKQSSK